MPPQREPASPDQLGEPPQPIALGSVTASPTPTAKLIEIEALRASLPARLWEAAVSPVRRAYWRVGLARFGRDSTIQSPAFVFGGNMIEIGERVRIWRHARLEAVNAEHGAVRISVGDRTVIQPYVHIGAAESVRIGANVGIGQHVFITDHDHDISNPFENIFRNRRLSVAPVRVHDHVWLGDQVIVLKGVEIGAHSVIGAGSIVTKSIPPLCIAVGSPARVVRRYDEHSRAWVRLD